MTHKPAPWDVMHETGNASKPEVVACSVDPNDVAVVQRLGNDKTAGGPRVAVYTANPSESKAISAMLTPADARRFAAAILNAADDADGTTPLVFLPEAARRKPRGRG